MNRWSVGADRGVGGFSVPILCLMLTLLPPQGQAGADATPDAAHVQVWQETLPGRVVYHYRVTNRQVDSAIPGVIVGYDYRKKELLLSPALPAGSRICSPNGWRGEAIADDASGKYNIVWGSVHVDYDIMGIDELTGFAVEVPAANDGLANTFFNVEFSPGKIAYASAPIMADEIHAAEPLENCIDPYTGKSSGTAAKKSDKNITGGNNKSGCDD